MKKLVFSVVVFGLLSSGVAMAQNGTGTQQPKAKTEKKADMKKSQKPAKKGDGTMKPKTSDKKAPAKKG